MLHYNPRHVSSINMLIFRRTNCIITASGIVTLCKRLCSMPDESRLQLIVDFIHTHGQTYRHYAAKSRVYTYPQTDRQAGMTQLIVDFAISRTRLKISYPAFIGISRDSLCTFSSTLMCNTISNIRFRMSKRK
jgi:hypothetical protein